MFLFFILKPLIYLGAKAGGGGTADACPRGDSQARATAQNGEGN